MGLIEFLDRLRSKPVSVRRNILWVTTVVLWLLIIGVWWTAVSFQPSDPRLIGLGEALSPFRALGKTISATMDMIFGTDEALTGDMIATGTPLGDILVADTNTPLGGDTDADSSVHVEWSGGIVADTRETLTATTAGAADVEPQKK